MIMNSESLPNDKKETLELMNHSASKAENFVREEPTPGFYIKARYVIAVLAFFGNFCVYTTRLCLSVALVAMVNTTKEVEGKSSCPKHWMNDTVTAKEPEKVAIFNWDTSQQGLVLGCYFYGYFISNVPGGWLAKRFGVRIVWGSAMLLSSVITMLSPVMAKTSFALFVGFRIFMGFLQGVSSPAMTTAWGKWAPTMERSRLISIHFSGSCFGTFVSLPIAGAIADHFGWEAVFYSAGGFIMAWSVLWLMLVSNSPEEHPRISVQEKKYIMRSIQENMKYEDEHVRTPWMAMLTSLPVWSINLAHFASNWGNYTLISMLPMYMATVLNFNLSASGALSSLPFILQFLFTVGGGYATDFIRSRRLARTVVVRKINTTLGLVIPAIFVVLAGYIGCNVSAALAFFSVSVAFNGLTTPGCKANCVDIAPKYGGIVYGMSNTIASLPGFLAPQAIGILLLGGATLTQWQHVFWLSAAVYCLGAIVYIVFGSGVEQHWANGEVIEVKNPKEEKMTNSF